MAAIAGFALLLGVSVWLFITGPQSSRQSRNAPNSVSASTQETTSAPTAGTSGATGRANLQVKITWLDYGDQTMDTGELFGEMTNDSDTPLSAVTLHLPLLNPTLAKATNGEIKRSAIEKGHVLAPGQTTRFSIPQTLVTTRGMWITGRAPDMEPGTYPVQFTQGTRHVTLR